MVKGGTHSQQALKLQKNSCHSAIPDGVNRFTRVVLRTGFAQMHWIYNEQQKSFLSQD